MRVISGIYKSRKLTGYNMPNIRPTMDKVKESIFAMLNLYSNDSVFLDLFGGTGAIGIEAISNGAKESYIIDNDKNSINVINKNINDIGIKNIKVIHSDYKEAIKNFSNNEKKFDIIFIDPPYGRIKIKDVLNKINEYNILCEDGLVVCEYEDEKIDDNIGSLILFKDKKYGKTVVRIYKSGK